MSKFKFVVVSKDQNFNMNRNDFGDEDIVRFIGNNKTPITQVYNLELNEIRSTKDCDFVVFMHGDVKIDVGHLKDHIEECREKYDVFGLCGCEKVVTSQSPLNWFTSSNPYPQFRWGCVTHGEDRNRKCFYSGDRSEIRDHAVGAIDGLCIIFGEKAINSDLCFDEKFLFDFYDTDISFSTILKYKMRLGVLVEESLQHYSIGKSILTDDFLTHEIYFRRKWGLQIPKGSRIEMMIENEKTNT